MIAVDGPLQQSPAELRIEGFAIEREEMQSRHADGPGFGHHALHDCGADAAVSSGRRYINTGKPGRELRADVEIAGDERSRAQDFIAIARHKRRRNRTLLQMRLKPLDPRGNIVRRVQLAPLRKVPGRQCRNVLRTISQVMDFVHHCLVQTTLELQIKSMILQPCSPLASVMDRSLLATIGCTMNWSKLCAALLLPNWLLFAAMANTAAQEKGKKGPTVPAGVEFLPDIEYGAGGGEKLRLDLAKPAKLDRAAPCIVVIHGGGWAQGDKKQHHDQIFKLAQQGYVAATVQYRFAPKHRFPAAVEDVKCAVRYLRAHADEHKINPSLLGAVGFSAGGHLAMMLGVMGKDNGLEGTGGNADQSSQVQCVVGFFGPTDLTRTDFTPTSVFLLSNFMGSTPEEDKGERKRASPVTYLDQGDAPLLIFQGTKDPLVPHTQALVMGEAMTKAGVPGRVELLIGGDHGGSWGAAEYVRVWDESLRFFGTHLKPKPVK